jgi:pyruvate,water dikinase
MRGWLKRQWRKLEERRQQKAGEYLQLLKVRYHLFRAILDSNHHAVSLITGLEVKLTDPFLAPSLLGPQISDLIETTGQMVEKMIRLGGDRYQGLTGMHQKVAVRIKTLLEELPSANGLPLCLPLDQVDLRLRSAVGGKAAALAHLRAKGLYGVPDGFVVPVHACRFFLEQEDLSRRLLKGLAQHLRASAEIPAQVIRETAEEILAAPLPADLEVALLAAGRAHLSEGGPGLAVRSSAIAEDGIEHSFAGQYTTILNVTTEAELVTSFKKVVASSFSARSIAYRLHAGLDPLAFDMAVLCLRMIPARASGILLTRDPTSPQADHMLISAVFGLGEPAVSGDAMTDLYHPSRDPQAGNEPPPQIARKDLRLLCRPEGGVTEAPVPPEQQEEPVLSPRQQETLRDWGLALEREQATPLDIEWAVDGENQLHLLQSRPLKVDSRAAGILVGATGPRKELLSGGIATSGGRATGKVFLARSRQDLDRLPDGPLILVMHRSMVDAARILNRIRGVAVDFGNPADHLSCVSREYAIPMLSGLGTVTDSLEEGQWVTIDAASGCIWQAERDEIEAALRQGPPAGRPKAPAGIDEEKLKQLRNAIVKLNLTDAYGPTFSILECRSLHDLVRFIHEKAVMAMFNSGDMLIEKAFGTVFALDSEVPFFVSIIDLGGGLQAGTGRRRKVPPSEILSGPFRALWHGVSDPRLHWGPPPGGAPLGTVASRFLVDQAAERPIGMPNYAIVSRDYFNLNARMDFHFIMIDSVCSATPENNYIRFRFKGGGTAAASRRRRALCITEVLQEHHFFTDMQEDLVNGDVEGAPGPVIADKLTMLGRLLGFTRLLDAAMVDAEAPHRAARSFLEGDFHLSWLDDNQPEKTPTPSKG